MRRIAVLVDFDNCRNDRLERAIGRGVQNLSDYVSVFDDMVASVVSAIRTNGERSEFQFRLYGGWFESSSGDPTELHNIVVQCVNRHPRQISGQRLQFEIAYAPLFRGDLRFEATLRTEAWTRPEGKVNARAICKMSGASSRCQAIDELSCWVRGNCPVQGCSGRLQHVASRRGQKLVDTLLVADAVIAGISEQFDQVVVLSADEDMLPGLLFQCGEKCTLALARLNYSSSVGRYDQMLHSQGVKIYDL